MSRGRGEVVGEAVHKAIDASERVLERATVEAKKRPVSAAAFTAVEVVGTIVAFGFAETVLAGTAMYIVYRALTDHARSSLGTASRRAPAARPGAAPPGSPTGA